ncbi:MAG: 30S ribosomal protein S8, partial [Acidimicrobiaceae bacterium]|nr:30S ribosomal protein S8 [Acidimicrobiaceae bacterium]
MTMTDPIADMLTRIRNANVAMHDEVSMPSSKRKLALADVLQREGYIASYAERDNTTRPGKTLTIEMKYSPERDRVI